MRSLLTTAVCTACCIAVMSAIGPDEALAGAFTTGNLVVVRAGTGTGTPTSAAIAIFLDEYTTTGGSVQVPAVSLPTAVSGSNRILTESGTSVSEGGLSLSEDGRYLLLSGYDAAVGTLTVSSSSAGRVVGRVDLSGNSDASTNSTAYGTSAIRSASSLDGWTLWTAGAGTPGSALATLGATNWTQLSRTVTNLRQINAVNNQLYTSSGGAGFVTVNTIGSGMPVTESQTISILPGMTTTSNPSPYDYWFADANTVYVANDNATGNLRKWTRSGGNWSVATTFTNSPQCRGITGIPGSSPAVVFVVSTTAQGSTSSAIAKMTDAGASSAFSTIVSAARNTNFRGIRYLPTNTCGTITMDGIAESAYGSALATQACNTDYGDSSNGDVGCANGSELDRALGVIRGRDALSDHRGQPGEAQGLGQQRSDLPRFGRGWAEQPARRRQQ